MKTILTLLGCVIVLGIVSLPGGASQQEELPWWPMHGFDAAGTGHCPYVGIDYPWLVPFITQGEIEEQLGAEFVFRGDFFLTGKDGTFFIGASAENSDELVLLALDPESRKVLWEFPILGISFYDYSKPAVGPDGTVYAHDRNGDIVGLDPETGAVIWRPKCEECLPKNLAAFCTQAHVPPFIADIIVGPQGYIYAWIKGSFLVVFGPPPEHPVIGVGSTIPLAFPLSRPVVDRDGTIYFLSTSKNYRTIIAITQDGALKWKRELTSLPALSSGFSLNREAYLIAGEKDVYVLAGSGEKNVRVIAIDVNGKVAWSRDLEGFSGHNRDIPTPYPRPVYDPESGLLYIPLFREDGEWLVALDTQARGISRWEIRVGGTPSYSSNMILTAAGRIILGTKEGLVQVDAWAGERISCPISFTSYILRGNITSKVSITAIAMAPDGTIYALAWAFWPNEPALLKSVRNQPPRIASLQQVIDSVDEKQVHVHLSGRVVDSLGWNRQWPVVSVDWGDGETDIDELFCLHEEEGHYQGGFIFAHTYPAGETYTPKVKVAAEGCEEFYTEKTITVCLEPPTIERVEATPRCAYAGTTSVEFECSAAPPQAQSGSPLVYRWDFGDGATQRGSEVSHRYTEQGTYQAKVTVNVADSSPSASATVDVVVKERPTLTVTVSPAEDQPEAGVKFDFQCTVEDPFGQTPSSFTWSFGDGETSIERTPSHLYTDLGTYDASVEVLLPGNDENPSASLTREFQVCAQPPEIRALKYFPEPAHVGVPVEFSCTVQGCRSDTLTYTWDFGDGQRQLGDGLSAPSHQYDAPGTYTVQVTVGTPPLAATQTIELPIFERPQKLTATATAEPSYGSPPLVVTFTGAAAAPEGTSITGYKWDFDNDGTTDATGQTVTHTFDEAGDYTVTLTVTDNNGNTATAARVIIVSEQEVNVDCQCLKVFYDSLSIGDQERTYSGDVKLNGFLGVDGTVTVASGCGEITGTGNLETGGYTIHTGGNFTIEGVDSDAGGCFRPITWGEGDQWGFTLNLYGFDFSLRDPKLYEDRLAVTATVKPVWLPLGEISGSVSISQDGVDLGGKLKLPDFEIGGFGIKGAFIEHEAGSGNSWRAGVSLDLPKCWGKGLEIGATLGILDGDLNELSVSISDFPTPIPIGNTGAFLSSLEGGFEHLASGDPLPVVLHAGAGFYAGPEFSVPSIDLLSGKLKVAGGDYHLLGGDLTIDVDLGGKVMAGGDVYLVSSDFGTIGEAALTIDVNRGVYLGGTIYNPPGDAALFTGTTAGKLDFDGNFQASMSGTLKVPDALPLIGGMEFGEAVGYIDNDLMAFGVEVGEQYCVWGHCVDVTLQFCLQFSFDDWDFSVATNWDAIQEVELTRATPEYARAASSRTHVASRPSRAGTGFVQASSGTPPPSRPPATYAFAGAASQTGPQNGHVFEIPVGLAMAIFHMHSEEGRPEFTVITPGNKEKYDETSDRVIWRRNNAAGELWCAVPEPEPGNWTVVPDDSLTGTAYEVTAYKLNAKPTLTITSPKEDISVEVGEPVTISWEATDPDDEAKIRLCYTESPLLGANGLPSWPGNTIVNGLSEESPKPPTHSWDTTDVAPGKYYIYGVITDGKNFPVFAWSEGSVTVRRPDFPPPEHVTVEEGPNKVLVGWDSVDGAVGYRVYYQRAEDTAPMVLAASQVVWGETHAELLKLEPGQYRIAVTALGEDGSESDLSEVIEVVVQGG